MNDARLPPADRVPTLTEVLGGGGAMDVAPAVSAAAPFDERGLVDEVMSSLQQRMDLMFEYRLREAIAPVLARIIDGVVDEARVALAATLRDVVARAVAQEVARRRQR